MRVTIIPADGFVSVDGQGANLTISGLPANVHAIQWYGAFGEVEIIDPITMKTVENQRIDSLDPYQGILDAYNVRMAEQLAIENAAAEAAAQAATYVDGAFTGTTPEIKI